ncbi:MAG: hypothetical protein GX580_16330 [Candidatus Hydrogenedens sp.]|nr:hypothetical protein [Candidatus Hydrogenedentota bacterium]NLF59198.1 hypothetical protein [Candidatus Hydrogenedens sp.]
MTCKIEDGQIIQTDQPPLAKSSWQLSQPELKFIAVGSFVFLAITLEEILRSLQTEEASYPGLTELSFLAVFNLTALFLSVWGLDREEKAQGGVFVLFMRLAEAYLIMAGSFMCIFIAILVYFYFI